MALTIKQQMEANSKAWHTADATTRKQLEATNQKLGSQLGASYDSKTGSWSDKSGGSLYGSTKPATTTRPATTTTTKPATTAAKQTSYYDPTGKQQTGYIINGTTYKDQSGTQRIDQGSVVQTGGGYYKLGADGKGVFTGNTYKPPATTQGGLPNGATKTTITRNGQSINGYILNNQTYDDKGQRVGAGDIVNAANGNQYMMTEAGKGVDLKASQAANVYGKDSVLGIPDLSKASGQTYMLDGKYYDSQTGKLAGAGFIDMGDGTYYDAETGQRVSQEVIEMTQQKAALEAQMAAIQQAQLEANEAAMAAAEQDILATQQAGNQELDAAAAQSEISSYNLMDNLALRSARMGDQGGIGQKQYGEAANANDKRLLEISLEKRNLETSTGQQIAQLQAQGKMNEAQIISDLGMKQLELLTAEEDKLRSFQQDQELTNARLLGTYKGQPTVATQEMNYNRALQRLQLGVFSAEDAVALGIPADQAKMFTDTINIMAQIDLEQARQKLAELVGGGGVGTTRTAGGPGGANPIPEQTPLPGQTPAGWTPPMANPGASLTPAAQGDTYQQAYNLAVASLSSQPLTTETQVRNTVWSSLKPLVESGSITEQQAQAIMREIGVL